MKIKRTLSLLLLVVLCLLALPACGDDSTQAPAGNNNNKVVKPEGYFYLYENDATNTESWVRFEKGRTKWVDSTEVDGVYEYDGNTIIFYIYADNGKGALIKEELLRGTLVDGKLTLTIIDAEVVYYQEGKAPDSTPAN